jgi:hypothetical protein
MPEVGAAFWKFVSDHINEDVSRLRLKYHGVQGDIDYELAILQIECRKKFGKKISDTLAKFDGFIFPNSLAGEQCTSDALAIFHRSLIVEGESVCDLTSGLGIDCLHVADIAKSVTAVERQEAVAAAVVHNAQGLGYENVKVINDDSCALLRDGALSGDVAFIDPARRTQSGGRAYALSDCEPNVVELLPELSKHFKRMVVKMSPMLDITQTLRELSGVTDMYAIGTHTECKELVATVDLSGAEHVPTIHAVTVNSDGTSSDFSYTLAEESAAPTPNCSNIAEGNYVYEPIPAVMKAAPMRLLASRYGLNKLHNNTHVFFSAERIDAVPAEVWRVERIIAWQSKNIKRVKSEYPRIDVAVRNFGMTADALRAKLGVKQGGDCRLLGVTDCMGNKLMLVMRRP